MRDARLPESPDVPSPCVRNCCLDEDDVCLGCGRLLSEILVWRDASPGEKEAISVSAAQRLVTRGRGRGD